VPRTPLRLLTIVTFGRSGSTALQSALNAHPDVLIRGENYNALSGLWNYWGSLVDSSSRHHSGKPNSPWFGTAKLDPEMAREDLTNHVYRTLLRPKASTLWAGFKEVRYEVAYFPTAAALCSYLLFLQELLPGLSFLINTRNPQSAARSGWWQQHPNAQTMLQQTNDIFLSTSHALTNMLGDQRVQLIDYDSWRLNHDLLVESLKTLGFPVDRGIIEQSLSTVLTHGQSAVRESH
jgi:hypothetical protein